MRFLFLGILFFNLITGVCALELKAPQAYMVDLETGTVLFDKNGDQKMAPSSLSKIMTAYLVFDRLKHGDIKLTDTLPVSQKAWKMEGSRMFLPVDAQVKVDDLLKGVIVQSGNDACVVLAEGLAGSDEAFAEEMTRKAHEIGAVNTHFVNTTGLPDPQHLTTCKDLALIAERTIRDFPQYFPYYAMQEFTYNNITQPNRNVLLGKNMGADGMKTGHTDAGGYGLVGTAKQGDRRIVMVINGLPTATARNEEATTLMKWGFNYFKNYKIFSKGDVVEKVDVWGGADKTVPVIAGQDVVVTLPRHQRRNLQAKVIYNTPLAAPLKVGTVVGTIEVTVPERDTLKIPLLVGKEVSRAWFPQRIRDSLSYLLLGKH